MYVWRNKHRRDRRDELLDGSNAWKAPRNANSIQTEDEKIRQENEREFVECFKRRVRRLIGEYLKTTDGRYEVNVVIGEIEAANQIRAAKKNKDEVFVPPEMQKRSNIYEIFRTFDTDGSGAIDIEELIELFHHLAIPIADDEFIALFESIDSDKDGEVNFDEFYDWFTKEASRVKSKNRWKALLAAPSDLLYNKFKRLSQEVEAKNLIIDHIIYTTAKNALQEFRIAHPALFACSLCDECFLSPTALVNHMNDVSLHLEKEKENDKSKFAAVDAALNGKEGRKLVANRLLFNVDLSHISTRLEHVKHQPYRPHLDDVDSKHEEQLRRGMKVVGSDAKAGIRPLQAQHKLHMQHKLNPDYQNTLLQLQQTSSTNIDTYTTSSASTHVDIRFEWKGYVRMDIFLISEANGWKPERMVPDSTSGRYISVKSLSPGVYRYRFIVDGVERIEEKDSSIWEGEVQNNILRVVNPPLTKKKKNRYEKYMPVPATSDDVSVSTTTTSTSVKPEAPVTITSIDLHNSGLYDDGTWALLSRTSLNTTITSLDLSNNNISDEGMMAVAQMCQKLQVLEVLKVNGNGFSFDGCRYLAGAFRENSLIRRLELCANRIGNDGATVLANLLHHHRSIQELYLDSNYIDNDGAADIGQSLQHNISLRVLSLSKNMIHSPGSERLCYFLRFNATLEVLNLSNNPLYPEGCKYVGELISITDSLISLNISNTHLMHNKLNQGLYTITAAMRKNKSIKTLLLRNNAIPNEGALEIAYAMNHNRTITTLDVTGNLIHQQWFIPNFYLKTRLLAKMPTLQTSLDRNSNIEKDPILSVKWSVQPREQPYIPTGSWTRRRKWKPLTLHNIQHEQAKKENQAENDRIEAEEEHLATVMDAYQSYFDRFLSSDEGNTVVKATCKVIVQYLKALHSKSPPSWIDDVHFAILDAMFFELNNNSYITVDQLTSLLTSLGLVVHHVDKIASAILNRRTISRASSRVAPETARTAVSTASVLSRNSSKTMTKAMSNSEIEVTDETKINLVKFYNYFKDNYAALVANMSIIDSVSAQSKLILLQPVSHAKHIISQCTINDKRRNVTMSYRREHAPKYLCHHCGSRFASERQLHKHTHKAKIHSKFDRELYLWESQMKLTRRAKYVMTGTYFPSYYELISPIDLPKLYAPQICDERGDDGRPVGVVEHDQTYRIEDSWGDWLQIRHNGHMHWTRYRVNGVMVMIPSEVDMAKLESYDKPVYYIVAPGLGASAEIKVRKKPQMQAEVAGGLTVGMVVAVWAKYDNWLQIKYLHYDALWVLEKVDDIVLFTQLHPYLQLKLPHIITSSPQVVPPEQLILPKKNKFAHRELALGNAAKDADSVGSLDSADSW